MDAKHLPTNIDDCHRLIATLQRQVQSNERMIERNGQTIDAPSVQLSLKDKLIDQQAHCVLELKAANDKLEKTLSELNLKIEKLLHQLYGRKSERRIGGVGVADYSTSDAGLIASPSRRADWRGAGEGDGR